MKSKAFGTSPPGLNFEDKLLGGQEMFKDITKRKGIILCGILVFSAFGAVARAAEIKIGYVDMQRALNESEAGKEAKVVMETEYKTIQTEIAQRERELQTLQETLQRQGMMLSEKGRKEKEREYQNRLKEYKRWREDRLGGLKQKERDFTKATLGGLAAVVTKLGEDEKFTVILEKGQALYISGTTDLTDRVITIFNSTNKK
jgi:outer membrane protein